jgi:hypothetical protein
VDYQGREGLFPIAVVFANEDGSEINVFTADHIGNPGELLRGRPGLGVQPGARPAAPVLTGGRPHERNEKR